MPDATCAVEGCDRVAFCRGWCRPHYRRWAKDGRLGDPVIPAPRKGCTVDGCDRPHLSRGYCNAHYSRWKTKGDPGAAAIQIKDASRRCIVAGCDIKAAGHGLCRTHLARQNKSGSVGQAYVKHLTDPTVRNEAGEKRCPSCEQWLVIAEFTKCDSTPDRLYKRCRTCTRAATLWNSYGLTVEAFQDLLRSQGGGCRICATVPESPYSLHVDHDHACCNTRKKSCGKCVRGLLCSPCNTALGLLADDPVRLRAAADYLEQTHGRG